MKDPNKEEELSILLKQHQFKTILSYRDFKESLLATLTEDLGKIEKQFSKELSKTMSVLGSKLKSYGIRFMEKSTINFFLQPFVIKEQKELKEAVDRLKMRINEYVNQFYASVLEKNAQKTGHVSLFHVSNTIKSFNNEWYSVTSRSSLRQAQIYVQGFNRPITTWLALGVSRQKKEYGPVKNSISSEDFMGNIYLNGSDQMEGKHRLSKDLVNGDIFVIQNKNRMIFVYRKSRGRNKNEIYLLEDNLDYYFYVAFKGPILLKFSILL